MIELARALLARIATLGPEVLRMFVSDGVTSSDSDEEERLEGTQTMSLNNSQNPTKSRLTQHVRAAFNISS